MSCLIKLYESRLVSSGLRGRPIPIHANLQSPTVELVAIDQVTLANCCSVQTNGRLASGFYGAQLPFPATSIVYRISIVDTAQTYAGATVPNLNGDTDGELDVVLFKLPDTPIGPLPFFEGSAQARAAALSHPSWSDEEKWAVLSLIDALGSLRGATAHPVTNFIYHYEMALKDLGINPVLF